MFQALRLALVIAIGLLSASCAHQTQRADQELVQSAIWQCIEIDFEGPQTSEVDPINPFTDRRLTVTFRNGDHEVSVPGFYAADGNAAETGADAGRVWRVRFAPDRTGKWTYTASLHGGKGVALSQASARLLDQWEGSFQVGQATPSDPDFYRAGVLRRAGRYFRFSGSGEYWLKGGANSPENLLGYADFDGTYRMEANVRDGESDGGKRLHTFAPHIRDWRPGDPTWQGGKGKGLIGAINYLADQGMNAAYFLVFNVGGDGKDVWPWRDPQDRTRFDVSKLAQWEIVFAHMQRRGIALHIVLQETENELFLDGGDTGPNRKLMLRELVARFGHHPALFWNLGEENGPVHWRPEGQSHDQREAMAAYLASIDVYTHPILLHTHAEAADKDAIVGPLLGNGDLDGLSFQVAERETVNAQIRKWHDLSAKAGRVWPITMDEIGKWQVGARADIDDPQHDSLRQHALWGTLLAGGAGVEWYFGAEQAGNDLDTEDWRSRANLWRQTRIALEFFEQHLPFARMRPCTGATYCLRDEAGNVAFYLSADTPPLEPGSIPPGSYRTRFFDPVAGMFDQTEIALVVEQDSLPAKLLTAQSDADRVVLMTKIDRSKAPN